MTPNPDGDDDEHLTPFDRVRLRQREIGTRLEDHIAMCNRDKEDTKKRIDGIYKTMWTVVVGLLILIAGTFITHLIQTPHT
jgi:hypothetical protein